MTPGPLILYTAAHGGFPDTAPLGGGKAVADYLVREWGRSRPFALTVLSPHAVGLYPPAAPAPSHEPWARFTWCSVGCPQPMSLGGNELSAETADAAPGWFMGAMRANDGEV